MVSATSAQLTGLFPPHFTPEGRIQIRIGEGLPEEGCSFSNGPLEIRDARSFQALAESESIFFDQHGFALLPHRTAVREWDSNPEGAQGGEVARIYYPEIEQLVRQRLFPGRQVEVHQWSPPIRRGRDTPTPQYGSAVHSDYGLTPEDFEVSVEAYADCRAAQAWRRSYEREAVEAFMMIDFWRPTNMAGPLLHMPLALCDPTSVEIADLVPTAMIGIAPSGRPTHHVALRYNPDQHWYYYPRMRIDEVLAFKLFECRKDDPGPSSLRSVLHTAFVDPNAPQDAQERQSCEHRVGVVILRD